MSEFGVSAQFEALNDTYSVDLALDLTVGNMSQRKHSQDGLQELLVGHPVCRILPLLLNMLVGFGTSERKRDLFNHDFYIYFYSPI